MSSAQIVGIVVAVVVVLLLVLAVLVARGRRHGEEPAPAQGPQPTQEPQQEQSVSFLDAPPTDTLAGLGRAEREPKVVAPPTDDPFDDLAPALAWEEPAAPAGEQAATADHEPDESEITAEIVLAAAEEPQAEPRMLSLSDVIVTTSTKMVDVNDAEVRRMLTDLVVYEIDQATEYRQRGQTVDAVLQLTEAERICSALGLTETAERIEQMMDELKS